MEVNAYFPLPIKPLTTQRPLLGSNCTKTSSTSYRLNLDVDNAMLYLVCDASETADGTWIPQHCRE